MKKITQTKMTFKADNYANARTIKDILELAFHYLEKDEPKVVVNWEDETESNFFEVDLFFNFTTILRRCKLETVFELIDSLNLLAVEKPTEEEEEEEN